MDIAFLEIRIRKTKRQIIAYEDAIEAFAADGLMQTYKLDTGQTTQTVTRANLDQMQQTLDTLYNRLATFERRLNGSAVLVRPRY